MITIRRFLPGDVEAAVALERSAGFGTWTEGIFHDELAADDRLYLVCESGGELAGFAGVMVVGEEAHVTNLLIAPERRRQGIATRLLKGLVEASLERGARHLTLEVRSTNHAARALYGRLGLAPVGVRKGYYGDDDALILWAHDIGRSEFMERLG
ncbi:MAG: ribosomal protein S18-alanine N-acetyltransferase [Actinobacteria bacterium]|nr:ribosomal protein S18-alanine N-acetyltransferase [Actinomycetota bacterium]